MFEDGDTMIVSLAPLLISGLIPVNQSEPFKINQTKTELHDLINFITKPYNIYSYQVIGSQKAIFVDYGDYLNRYEELYLDEDMTAIPYEKNFFDKIVWPLKNAKVAYMIENYIGTISFCGLICEMIALLLYEMYLIENENENIDNEKNMFANERQIDRIKKLKSLRKIDQANNDFDDVRKKRNKYVHDFCTDYSNIQADAKSVYFTTHKLVKLLIKPTIYQNSWSFGDEFTSYLESKGCITKPSSK